MSRFLTLLFSALLVSGCASTDTGSSVTSRIAAPSTTVPTTPAMSSTSVVEATTTTTLPVVTPIAEVPAPASVSEIEQLAERVASFAADNIEAWPDIEAVVGAGYTDDFVFADPTWSDYLEGSETVVGMLEYWESVTDYTVDVTAFYVSADGAAFEESWPGLQPPMRLPPDPPVARGLTVYTFEGDMVAGEDLWYWAEDNVAYGIGCFAVDACPALQETVDTYVDAWTSRDRDAVAALYSQDATFSDSLPGLGAAGPEAIAELVDGRFGSGDRLVIEVLGLYAWTAGMTPPTDLNPDAGQLLGVAIHYRATVNGTETQEAITTLELGVKTNTGIDPDPQGLIHHEEVYQAPETLLATLRP